MVTISLPTLPHAAVTEKKRAAKVRVGAEEEAAEGTKALTVNEGCQDGDDCCQDESSHLEDVVSFTFSNALFVQGDGKISKVGPYLYRQSIGSATPDLIDTQISIS